MSQRYLTGPLGARARAEVVALEHLQLAYAERIVLPDLSCRIYDGMAAAFLGPTGSGKTTLLAALQGLIVPTQGQIRLFGLVIPPVSPGLRRDIGVMPQVVPSTNNRTVEEYTRSFAWPYGTPLDVAQAASYLAQFGLSADDALADLSRVQRRLLALAVAVLHDPSLVLLDEPLAGCSEAECLQIWPYLHRLRREGRTLLVTFTTPVAETSLSEYDLVIYLNPEHAATHCVQ